jgi:hypothetical protein
MTRLRWLALGALATYFHVENLLHPPGGDMPEHVARSR